MRVRPLLCCVYTHERRHRRAQPAYLLLPPGQPMDDARLIIKHVLVHSVAVVRVTRRVLITMMLIATIVHRRWPKEG
eukprot:2583204-Pyramimonas_sp.AAC.2